MQRKCFYLLPDAPKQLTDGFAQLELHALCPEGHPEDMLRYSISLLDARGL